MDGPEIFIKDSDEGSEPGCGTDLPEAEGHTGFEQSESNQGLSNMRLAMSDVATFLAGQLDPEAASEGVDDQMTDTSQITQAALHGVVARTYAG